MNKTVAKLAVSSATYFIDKPYSYIVPEKLVSKASPGMRVLVPFGRGNKKSEAVILSITQQDDTKMLKVIESLLDDTPALSDESIKLAVWMSERFFCTVFDAFRAILPVGMWFKNGVRRANDKKISVATLKVSREEARILSIQKKLRAPNQAAVLELLSKTDEISVTEISYFTGVKPNVVKTLSKLGIISLTERAAYRRPQIRVIHTVSPIQLSTQQQTVYESLTKLLDDPVAQCALLYGVTGSGKTLVYLKLIEESIKRGKSAIVLVPEIALTPQLMSIFVSHFGDSVAVLHSALSVGERFDEWKRIREGLVDVVVGTRSAIFAPLSNIGLIVLDEEQEHTYKSENSPRYHAREIAKYRCVKSGALLVLGSATPSIESMYGAKNGKYTLLKMPGRYNKMNMPSVIIADMKKELQAGNGGQISSVLAAEINTNIERGEQSILFINRRGASTLVACGECGYTYSCPRCSVSMRYHSVSGRMMCHYCAYSMSEPDSCPECGGKLKYIGAGTQKVESELRELFPNVKIIRMDTDTVTGLNPHEKLLARFRDEKIPILLGTQMVTKGLDFENVTLVGVLNADLSLHCGEYRAHERTFSIITQVIGRSGRGDKPGRAVIQTYTPAHDVIQLSANQDYDSFYDREISMRRILGCPPITDLFTLTASGTDETAVLKSCAKLRTILEGFFADESVVKLLGPAPAPILKINNRYRYRLTIRGDNTKWLRDVISHTIKVFSRDKDSKGISVYADIDPYE